jgi:hypothetical protein
MLAVSRCWVSDHAAIASKSLDTKGAAPEEVGGAVSLPDLSKAEIPNCGEP